MTYNKKKTKSKVNWIYPKDLCWFKREQFCFPAEPNWTYSEDLIRLVPNDEPIVYVRTARKGNDGLWIHHFYSLGMRYVFHGTIQAFTKLGPGNEDVD